MDFRMLIGGQMVEGAAKMDVINPATGKAFAQAPRADCRQLEQAVAAAHQAFPAWAAKSWEDRRAVLLAMADVIEANAQEIAQLLTAEQGKPLAQAFEETYGTAFFFRQTAQIEQQTRVVADDEVRRVTEFRVPLGVVAAIVPWNFPLFMIGFKLPPALLAGNTVVLKPAPSTPLSALLLAQLIAGIVPAGVINVIADANDLGAQLASHPDVAKVSFTGSTATGRKVFAGAAETMKRLTLELGGNDAAIVLDDVDVKAVAPAIFRSAFANSGQVCIAIKRLYVQAGIYDALCNELAAQADAAIVGDGMLPDTQMGPIQNKAQFERVKGLIDEAETYGRVIASEKEVPHEGYFIRPTIVRDISDGTRLVDEEQFGPVLPVIQFDDVNDAILRANASPFGLGASVWSSDRLRAEDLACCIDAGTVWVNNHLEISHDVPFGGARQSGIGTEMGVEGLLEFTQRRIVNTRK